MNRCIVGFFFSLFITIFPSCHSSSSEQPASKESAADKKAVPPPMFRRNAEKREHVREGPVAEYKVKTDDKLNDQYFSVRLYETPFTMKYLARIEFEGLTGEDTIKLPDMGIPPHPSLEKGPEKYSCIIGLLDNDQQFRELKKVYVTDKGGEL